MFNTKSFLLTRASVLYPDEVVTHFYVVPSHIFRYTQVVEDRATILDINYVDFLQFQRYFIPQAELDEAFIYIIRKPIDFSIDFSYRHKT